MSDLPPPLPPPGPPEPPPHEERVWSGAQAMPHAPFPLAPPTQPTAPPVLKQGPDGLAVASFVLGILSCIACCSPLFGITFGVIGLILGLISKTRGGLRKAGVIMCIVGPAIALAWILLVMIGVAASIMSGAGGP